ncbi:unnamed protein product [Ilex paraguariensis]|uniref:Uncharacterized protein n=1 Tax=Ilex paraguariensis TaxID=185542 RepID=A0ABC8S5M9_9AQUA
MLNKRVVSEIIRPPEDLGPAAPSAAMAGEEDKLKTCVSGGIGGGLALSSVLLLLEASLAFVVSLVFPCGYGYGHGGSTGGGGSGGRGGDGLSSGCIPGFHGVFYWKTSLDAGYSNGI